MKSTIFAAELDKVIKAATSLIERGDLAMAGRTLNPIIAHINKQQRDLIIHALDSKIEVLFRKAYMLKPYEPERSRDILRVIVESGLHILPSYGKAKRTWDSEQVAVKGYDS